MSPTASKSKNPLSPKDRMKVPRQLMPEQPADVRAHNFEEVNLGYSPDLAQQEALRCLECAKPTCTDNCPVGIDVKEFVQRIVIGDFLGAAAKIREANVLPAITGRVCPQEDQCEGKCLLSKKVKPLGIGYLERFVADYEQRMVVRRSRGAPATSSAFPPSVRPYSDDRGCVTSTHDQSSPSASRIPLRRDSSGQCCAGLSKLTLLWRVDQAYEPVLAPTVISRLRA